MRLISHIISLRIFRRPKTRQKWEWILDFHLPGGREKWLQVDANSALCLAVKPSSNLQFDSSFGFFFSLLVHTFKITADVWQHLGNATFRKANWRRSSDFYYGQKIQRVERGHFSSGKRSCRTHELWPCPSISLAKKNWGPSEPTLSVFLSLPATTFNLSPALTATKKKNTGICTLIWNDNP